jgi:hypothetical protein
MMRYLPQTVLMLLGGVLVSLSFATGSAAQDQTWELDPYVVRIAIALDGAEVESPTFRRELERQLTGSVLTRIGPLWRPTVELRIGADFPLVEQSAAPIAAPGGGAAEAASPTTKQFDKTFAVRIQQTATRIVVAGFEHDHALNRAGEVQTTPIANLAETPEAVFRLLLRVFAPLSRFRVNEEAVTVALELKGAGLPSRAGAGTTLPPGAVLQPYFRRTDYTGALARNGIIPAAWTVVQLPLDSASNGAVTTAKIISHTARPFGVRRIGRIEQLAILLTNPPAPITLRLHVDQMPDERLPGYEVFRQRLADTVLVPLGKTDRQGELVVEPQEAPVDLLYVRLGSQLVARAPVAYAGDRLMTIPLPDERPRLAADATLAALREELVDLVARRNILVARIEARLEEGENDRARELLSELDRLPGRALFEQQLNRAEQGYHSSDPRVQRRIEASFAAVRKLLAQFLSNDKSIELGGRLSAAN